MYVWNVNGNSSNIGKHLLSICHMFGCLLAMCHVVFGAGGSLVKSSVLQPEHLETHTD